MKANDITNTDYAADKNMILSVKFNFGEVAVIIHTFHGVSPSFIRNSRAIFMRYLKAQSSKPLDHRAVWGRINSPGELARASDIGVRRVWDILGKEPVNDKQMKLF